MPKLTATIKIEYNPDLSCWEIPKVNNRQEALKVERRYFAQPSHIDILDFLGWLDDEEIEHSIEVNVE